MTTAPWTDRRVELVIGRLLRAGVLLAATVVAIGAVLYLARHGHAPADYRLFHGEPSDLAGLGGIWHDALSLSGRGIIQLGLVLLIATPIARVAFAVVGFAEERDRLYVGVTLIVLALLLYGVIWS